MLICIFVVIAKQTSTYVSNNKFEYVTTRLHKYITREMFYMMNLRIYFNFTNIKIVYVC
jgi:hypothetical protein